MPRTKLSVSEPIEHLSILDETGQLDEAMEPDIPESKLLEIYRAMLLGRRFDERMLDLQRQGRIGTFPPIRGHEAAQIGAIAVLGANDWFVPSFRETAAEIMRGRPMESILLYYNGYNEGAHVPETRRTLPMAVPVASQILHAVGLGYAIRYREQDEIVLTFFGDGATSQGDFHEGLNCAAVFGTPVVFVCQNNHWAISMPLSRQTRSPTLAQKALAYGIPGIRVDGNDVLAVYAASMEAAERARSGKGPTLIECVTYRVLMHTTADDPSRYQNDDEVKAWHKRDPLPRFETYLINKGVLSRHSQADMEETIGNEIQKGIDSAEERMRDLGAPAQMFNHLYAAMPPHLQRQRDEFMTRSDKAGEGSAHD